MVNFKKDIDWISWNKNFITEIQLLLNPISLQKNKV